MKYKQFILGFAACYALAGIIMATNAYQIPATTKAGAVYAGVMWLPISYLPDDAAVAFVPDWAFDFDNPKS